MLHTVYCHGVKLTPKDLKRNRIAFVGTEEECEKFAYEHTESQWCVDSFGSVEFHGGWMDVLAPPIYGYEPNNCFAQWIGDANT